MRRRTVLAMSSGVIGALAFAGTARASSGVTIVSTAPGKRGAPASIPPGYITMGQVHRVPPLILYGVALQESAQLFGDRTLPYPWTLNVHGTPRRFASYPLAVACLRDSVARGELLVDCGLLQVCWRYHHDKLGTFWAALDPYPNIGVGARILRSHFDITHDWFTAVGRYHNEARTELAASYAHSVYQRIARIPGANAQALGGSRA